MNQIGRLEALVKKAAKDIERLRLDNKKLKSDVLALHEEKLRLDQQFRRFKTMSGRQEKVRHRVERMLVKMDKVFEFID